MESAFCPVVQLNDKAYLQEECLFVFQVGFRAFLGFHLIAVSRHFKVMKLFVKSNGA
jgi:hypothetical protein